MPWFRVDDGFATHPKVLATSLAARGLWVTAGSWSSAHLTDGVVPDHVLASLGGTPELAGELVAAGLWRRVKGAWKFHQWHPRNPLKKDVLPLREARAAAGRAGGLASGKARSKNEANREALASPPLEPPSRPLSETTGSPKRAGPGYPQARKNPDSSWASNGAASRHPSARPLAEAVDQALNPGRHARPGEHT